MKERIFKVIKDPIKLGTTCFFFLILCWMYPVNSFLSRTVFLVAFLTFWVSPYIAGVRNRKFIIGHCLLTLIICFLPLILFKKPSEEKFRELYIKNLRSFEGTSYFWGGENFIGIDCSGLPRKSLINSYFYTGQLQKALSTWWYDSSAKALGENYRDYTKKIASFESLRKMDYTMLEAGDMAITANGVHVIVFLGDERWIQADPAQGKVTIENPHTTKSSWFDVKVNIVRWTSLNN